MAYDKRLIGVMPGAPENVVKQPLEVSLSFMPTPPKRRIVKRCDANRKPKSRRGRK